MLLPGFAEPARFVAHDVGNNVAGERLLTADDGIQVRGQIVQCWTVVAEPGCERDALPQRKAARQTEGGLIKPALLGPEFLEVLTGKLARVHGG